MRKDWFKKLSLAQSQESKDHVVLPFRVATRRRNLASQRNNLLVVARLHEYL